MRYLFDDWDKIKKNLNNKFIALFLDYDGTLTPIVNNPRKAILPFKTKRLLRSIVKNPQSNLAIISGRALKDLKKMINLKGIVYVGNHGLEIEGPKIKFESPLSLRYKRILQQIKDELNVRLTAIRGAFVEDKGLSLSVHYRMAERSQIPKLKTILYETTILYTVRDKVNPSTIPGPKVGVCLRIDTESGVILPRPKGWGLNAAERIKIKLGKKVFEIRPALEWDKGKVVLWLLARWKFGLGEEDLIPVYLGDDITDEDAFKVLNNKGITVFVGERGKSSAHYYLRDTREVADFLNRIALLPRSNL